MFYLRVLTPPRDVQNTGRQLPSVHQRDILSTPKGAQCKEIDILSSLRDDNEPVGILCEVAGYCK